MEKLFEYDEACRDCRNNPKAKKPYAPMKRLPTTDTTKKDLAKYAREKKVPFECAPCKIVQGFLEARKD
jgi:hypothetical protein